MNKITIIFTLLIISVLAGDATSQESKPAVQSLAFIAGCWEINAPARKRLVSEQWMIPVGDAMLGMSRTLRDGKLSGFEYMRIVQNDTGVHYFAKPSGNKDETAFKLIKWSANEAIFENPSHDFPQRIIYRLNSPDSLLARIEGAMNGKVTGMDFPMTRAKCV